MKKLVLATMAIVLFVSNTNAQEKLSAEDKERLQEIVKKVTSVAEEKARVVTFELNYKENFELANFVVDEESELAKKLSSSLDEATFNALKGNVKLTYGNGDFVVFATDDINNIGNAILAHAKERLVKGLYVTRSLEGSLSYGQSSFKDLFFKYKESSEQFYKDLTTFENRIDLEKNGTDCLKDNNVFEDWIKENLTKTKYENSEDAINDYRSLVSQQENLIKDNLDFFKEIEKNKEEFLSLLDKEGMFVSPVIPPNSTNGCVNNCINDAVDCGDAADENYAAAIGSYSVGAIWNPIVAGAGALYATFVHHNAQRACVRTFNGCIGRC